MVYAVIGFVAFVASLLTLFSGFGLGTLLMPAMAVFVPVELAVAMTAVVHLANNLFKLFLVGRHADLRVVLRFGPVAMAAAFLGAWVLSQLAGLAPWGAWSLGGREFAVTPVKCIVGVLLLGFVALEGLPALQAKSFHPRWLPLGGFLSGFFGGLSGNQGALRSAFLLKAGLTKEAFIGTGVVLACLIDVSRLALYARQFDAVRDRVDWTLLAVAVAAAFAGAWGGARLVAKVTLAQVQRAVGVLLTVVALGLIAGVF
jgi:uncharacterized protein